MNMHSGGYYWCEHCEQPAFGAECQHCHHQALFIAEDCASPPDAETRPRRGTGRVTPDRAAELFVEMRKALNLL